MHFAPLLLENLPLYRPIPLILRPPLGNLPIHAAKYVQILTIYLILRPLFNLRPGAAALSCPPLVTPLIQSVLISQVMSAYSKELFHKYH